MSTVEDSSPTGPASAHPDRGIDRRAAIDGGEALIAALATHGVTHIFGIPGTHNLTVYAAMARYGIRPISPRHEQGAGYAADGYARSSGRVGVCLTTTGPAALNAAAAAAQAQSDSIPVLFVAPGMPVRHPGRGNGLLHETISQAATFAGIVEHVHRVTTVEEIPAAVAEAFMAMTSARPRPAYLEIPIDVLEATGHVEPVQPLPRPRHAPLPESLAQATQVLNHASRPLVIAGGGASAATDELRDFVEKLGAPVVMTANGKGVLDEHHPLAIGSGLHPPAVAALARHSDVIVVIGSELAPADLWNGPLPISAATVRIDVDPHRLLTNLNPHVPILADAAIALAELSLTIVLRPNDVGLERAAAARTAFISDAAELGAPYLGLAEALDNALGDDGTLAGDSTMACYYGALSNTRRRQPRGLLYPSGAGTLGYGLPAGIGAKIARPDHPVIVLHGDGGLMFSVAELATAAELGLALPVVVIDNGGYGEIRNEMRDRGDTPVGVDLVVPDFPHLAEALGCLGVAANLEHLPEILRTALAADRPTLVVVRE